MTGLTYLLPSFKDDPVESSMRSARPPRPQCEAPPSLMFSPWELQQRVSFSCWVFILVGMVVV